MAIGLDNAMGLLFMEFARLGDLENWVHKLGRQNSSLPTEALWRIFDCLVKACIAMEYPPRHVPRPGQPVGTVAPTSGGDLPEVVPPGGQNFPATGFHGTVHFDMDPKNSMLLYVHGLY